MDQTSMSEMELNVANKLSVEAFLKLYGDGRYEVEIDSHSITKITPI